jgi:hypothetical protein
MHDEDQMLAKIGQILAMRAFARLNGRNGPLLFESGKNGCLRPAGL